MGLGERARRIHGADARRDCRSPTRTRRPPRPRACANCSRTAPCTCGMARRLKGSWVRRPALAARIALPARTRADARPTRASAGEARSARTSASNAAIGRAGSRTSWRRSRSAQSSRRSMRAGERRQTGGAGRAVDQAQAFLGLEHQRLRPAARSASAPAQPLAVDATRGPRRCSTEAMCAICVRYPTDPAPAPPVYSRRPGARASRSTTCTRTPEYPCAKLLIAAAMMARTAGASSGGPTPTAVAHDDVARQLALLGMARR